MQHAQPVHIEKAAPACLRLAIEGGSHTPHLSRNAAEGANDGHIADDVDQLAIDRRSLFGKAAMQRPRRRGEMINGQDHGERHQHQA